MGSYLFNSELANRFHLVPIQRLTDRTVQDLVPRARIALHLAGLAHQTQSKSSDPIYQLSNTELTEDFLRKSIRCGVEHFIFLSTVKVLGEGQNKAYTEISPPHPSDPYATSKWEAEGRVKRICLEEGISYTILRPPLMYGPHPKANIRSLVDWVRNKRPVPISSVRNQRSVLSLANLLDFLNTILQTSLSHNQTFLLQDPKPVSTRDLVECIAQGLGVEPRFFPIPEALGRMGFGILGLSNKWKRLSGSLFVDDSYTREVLDWNPPQATAEGVRLMVESLFKK